MQYEKPLTEAVLLSRYKRFLADIKLKSGEKLTVHCPNTGSMKNCLVPGSPCWISESDNPKRKYKYTLEQVTTACGSRAGINTGRANGLVVEAINTGVINELQGFGELLTEQRYGEENSRVDILLREQSNFCYVEVKSVTLAEDNRRGYFPDSVSARAAKHLRELMWVVEQGARACLCFCVQHSGIDSVAPAEHIDAVYAKTLREAVTAGVELIAYQADISAEKLILNKCLPIVL